MGNNSPPSFFILKTVLEQRIIGRNPSIQIKIRNRNPPQIPKKRFIIKKEMVKPADGWRLLHPVGAAERRRGEPL